MKIAILGWANLSKQAQEGSGYNLVASELALGIRKAGYNVYYLNSGRDHIPLTGSHIQQKKDWQDIKIFNFYNSPNLSPATYNFANLDNEIIAPEQTNLILNWITQHQINIIHIHSLEGFSLSLLTAVSKLKIPIIITPHDYWYICPQVQLLYQNSQICNDYQGGEKCSSCHPKSSIWKNKLAIIAKSILKDHFASIIKTIKPTYLSLKSSPQLQELPIQDIDNHTFLQQTCHQQSLNQFGQRRRIAIENLNQTTLITPPSTFLRDAYITMGLNPEKTQIVRLGLPHLDQLKKNSQKSNYYPSAPWPSSNSDQPLRLAFLGNTSSIKGLFVFCKAIEQLAPEIRQKCQFLIYAAGDMKPFQKKFSHYPEISWQGGYQIQDLTNIAENYDVGILSHIWFENSPIVLLEHLSAGKFVISSNLGGIIDWIQPPLNGLLYQAGNSIQLADCIAKIVKMETILPSPEEIHKISRLNSYDNYIQENLQIYQKYTQ